MQVPGAVVAAMRLRGKPQVVAVGVDGDGVGLAPDSLFPVASITKLAVALTVHRLISVGALALTDTANQYIAHGADDHGGVTIARLLSHTAGIPTEMPPFQPGRSWLRRVRQALTVRPDRVPGHAFAYTNVGYLMLGAIVEKVTGDFHAAIRSMVLLPLGIEAYIGEPIPRRLVRMVGDFAAEFNDPGFLRFGLPSGGLITTAEGALTLVRALAVPSAIGLSKQVLQAVRVRQTNGTPLPANWAHADPRPPYGLGVELRGTTQEKPGHWTPNGVSETSFGHYGASGGLVWCDPLAGLCWAIHGSRTSGLGKWPLQGRARLGAAILNALT
jgi:CubicO group peptidase (beta-lactamase class C family)